MASIAQVCNNIHPAAAGIELQKVLGGGVTDASAIRAEVVKLVTDITATRAEVAKLVTDLTASRAEVVKLVADCAALKAAHDTLATKLNADAGVTDVDYAATAAMTGAAPAAMTAVAPAAVTAVAPAALTVSP